MEKFIPFRPGLELGRGFNILIGDARGVAVHGAVVDSIMSGQVVQSNATIIESQQQFLDSLNLSVEASGHYGLFSAEGRFGLAQQSAFTSQSTYVVANCVVENAYKSYSRPALLPEAARRLQESGPEAFKTSYGDSFVMGLRSGGELYTVFQITATSAEQQKKLAVSVRAEAQALIAGGAINSAFETMQQSSTSTTSISVVFYQRAGSGSTIAPVSDPVEIAQRLKQFPAIANAHPVGYLAQLVDYQILDMPAFDEIGFRQREEALEDYMRLKLKLLGKKAEYQLVRQNPHLFLDPPSPAELLDAEETASRIVNLLNRHARKVANREIDPDLFVLSDYDPDLKYPDFPPFTKKAPTAELVEVPNLDKMPVEEAKKSLKTLGLSHDSVSRAVKNCSSTACNTVLRQDPPPGSMLPPKTAVKIHYNYLEQKKFPWKAEYELVRATERIGHRVVGGGKK
jgi:hypothetical protein